MAGDGWKKKQLCSDWFQEGGVCIVNNRVWMGGGHVISSYPLGGTLVAPQMGRRAVIIQREPENQPGSSREVQNTGLCP